MSANPLMRRKLQDVIVVLISSAELLFVAICNMENIQAQFTES